MFAFFSSFKLEPAACSKNTKLRTHVCGLFASLLKYYTQYSSGCGIYQKCSKVHDGFVFLPSKEPTVWRCLFVSLPPTKTSLQHVYVLKQIFERSADD
jgi:hypothetical protein